MRRALTILLCALAAPPLPAQVTPTVFGGFAWSHVTSSASDCSDCLSVASHVEPGFVIGAGIAAPVGPTLALAPELLLVGKGFKPGNEPGDQFAGCCSNFYYAELPLLVQWTSGERPERFVVFAGPHLAYRLACWSSGESAVVALRSSTPASSDCTDNNTFPSHPFDYGITVGAGLHLGRVSVTLRYDYGLANINATAGATNSVHNRSLLALAGLDLR